MEVTRTGEIERASIERAIIELEVMRREYTRPCGQSQSVIDKNQRRIGVIRLCKSMLRAELERYKNEPLTLEQMLEMNGCPIWTVTIGVDGSGRNELCTGYTVSDLPLHRVLRCVESGGEITDYDIGTYGKTWIAYRHQPNGDREYAT